VEEIKNNPAFFKTLFDASSEAIFVADDRGHYIHANHAACDLLGYDLDELIQLSVFDIVDREGVKFSDSDLPLIQSEDAPKGSKKHPWHSFIDGGHERGIIFCKRKDGTVLKLEYNAIRELLPGVNVSYMHPVDSLERIIAKLEAGEQRSKALIKAFPDLLFIIDYSGKYVDFIAGNENLLLLSRENFIGKYISDVLPAEIALEFHSKSRKLLETGENQFLDYALEIEGKKYFFDGKLMHFKDTELLFVARDITRIKSQELEYQELYSKFEAIIKAIPDSMFVIDKNGVFKDYFVSDEQQLVLDPEKIIGSTLFDLLPSEQVENHLNHYRTALHTKSIRVFEYDLYFDGQNRVYEARICPINEDDVLSIVREITEIHTTEKALRESEARFRNIFENASLGIFQTDFKGRIIKANNALARILGFDDAEQLTESVENVNDLYVNRADRRRFIELLKRDGQVHNFEFQARKKDGKIIFANTSARLVKDASGGEGFIEGFNTDITAQKEQIEFQKQIEIKEKAARLKDQFLANMSHEIRTPVTGIIGMTEIMKSTGLDENQSKYLGVITDSSRILLELINDILDLAKIEAGQMLLFPEPINFRDFLHNICRMFEYGFHEKGIQFELDLPEKMPEYIKVDSRRLKQILINLITNAMKFTQQGYVQLRLRVEAVCKNHYSYLIEIEDTGPGVPEKEQENIFKKFHQMNESVVRSTPGTGLGLAISRELVFLLGGKIGLKSKVGEGSTFWFSFKAGVVSKEEQKMIIPEMKVTKDLKFDANILVAEDKVTNQLVIKLLLQSFGCRVTLVKNGIEAIKAYKEDKFDLIFMDISMPEMDGYTALNELNKKNKNLCPVIVLSANNMQGAGQQYVDTGFDDFLSKPYTGSELGSILMKWIPQLIKKD
jgi:PAS domain S-box-containing protein